MAGSAGTLLFSPVFGEGRVSALVNPSVHLPLPSTPRFPFLKYLEKYHFWEYIPRDQGGTFIQMAIFGTEEDQKITAAVRRGVLEKTYGHPPEWQKYEKSEIEKSVWLNRLYFIPSFARMYHLTGDHSYLEDMMMWIRLWIKDNPRLPDSHRTTYNWRDMQVAWRAILLSWCYYLCEKGMTSEEKSLITHTLKEHAHILITGFGTARLNEFNHQSHGALAMLYLGILFPELEEGEELRTRAMVILNHHLDKAFYADGGNVEQMFGYYPFEAHIFRDAYLLCSANGLEPPAASLPMMQKMVRFLEAIARPDGRVPQVNDSFEMEAKPTVMTIREILGDGRLSVNPPSVYFPETQVAVIRSTESQRWYILANPASVIGAHAHAGRLAFELWYDNNPVVIDSGCCNYDEPDLVSWYRTSRAHNTVIIDGISDEATSSALLWVPRRETLNRITHWTPGKQLSYLTMLSPAEEKTNGSVRWTRSIALVKESFVVVNDLFETTGHHHYDILFHLPQVDVAGNDSPGSLFIPGEPGIQLLAAGHVPGAAWKLSTGLISVKGASLEAPVATYSFEGEGTMHSCTLFFPGGKPQVPTVASIRNRKNYSLLTVNGPDGQRSRLKIGKKGIKLID